MAFRMYGVIQTGSVDEALKCAQSHLAKGEAIRVERHEYTLWPEELEKAEEYRLSDGCFGAPLSHDPIEYEVYALIDDSKTPSTPSKNGV